MKTTLYVLAFAALALTGCQQSITGDAKRTELSTVKAQGDSRSNAEISRAKRKIEAHPDKAVGYNQLGQALMQRARENGNLADYSAALTAFEEAVKKEPEDAISLHNLAWCWTMFHQFDKALELAGRALKANPRDAFAHGVRFDSLMELGRYREAGEAGQQMLDLKPSLASYSRAAQYRWVIGDGKGAALLLHRAVSASAPYSENTLWCQVQGADIAFKMGNLQAAEQGYRAALDRDEKYRHALFGLGRLLIAKGKTDDGLKRMSEALEQNCPPMYRVEYAQILSRLNRKDEAAAQHVRIEEAVKEHLSFGIEGDEVLLAESWMAQGVRLPEALATMMDEAQHHTNWQTFSALAWAQYKNGQHAKAQASIDKALAVGAQEPTLWARAAKIAEANGNLQAARNRYSAAQNLNPYLAGTVGPAPGATASH